MRDEKYVVFKRDEFNNFMEWIAEKGPDHYNAVAYIQDPRHSMPLDDAVVIRTQDVFAAGGLYAYANNIHAWCEIEAADLANTSRYQAKERFDRLDHAREIADYFAERAYEADARDDGNRFPT